MERVKNRVKSVLRFFWEYKYSIVLSALIIAIILSGIHYCKNGKSAGASISFNYSEASNGLNPNNTRFNSYEILSDEVLERAISLAGLEGTLTADELAKAVSVNPVDTGNSGGDDDYISTTYAVSLNAASLNIKNRSAHSLLENLCNAYKEYFLEYSGDNQEILRPKLEVTTDAEPYLRLTEIKLRAAQLERYLAARMKQSRAFEDEESGMSFDEMDKRLNNIISYDIPNTSAFIIERGVAKNGEALTEILEYKNKMEAMEYDKNMAYYNADNGGIARYEKLMSSVIMIPTMDEQEQYYMSRTKTAMDKMARNADSELLEASAGKKEIVSTAYVIEKMKSAETGEESLKAAGEMINRLEKGLNDLAEDLMLVDRAYIEYNAQNYITFNYYKQSFIQRIDVKTTVAELLVLMLGLAGWLYAHVARKEQNEE